jgi:mannose/fructose/N-acetylgalactosamine-specific phosphotransferase system component IID
MKMQKFTMKIQKHLSGKKVLGLFIITNLIYTFMLVYSIPRVMGFSKGMKLLDMMPSGYKPEYVHDLFIALGKQGRAVYLTLQIPIDMIYPGLFALSYCLLLAYFLNKLNKLRPWYSALCLLPIIAGFFDYFENIGIIIMLVKYPEYPQIMANATNIFTLGKSITTSLYFVILLIILIWVAWQYLMEKRRT